MGVVVDTTGREYWQALLGAGGFTAVPRWTRHPTPGVAEHQEPIPEEVAAALYRLASSAALPLSSLLLAAHAKVLAALSGEVTVTTGFLVAGERPLPCRLSTEPATWRILLEHAREVEEQLMAHRNFPVGRLAGELGRPGHCSRPCSTPPAAAVNSPSTPRCGSACTGIRIGSSCGCATEATCSTPRPPPELPATTAAHSRPARVADRSSAV